MSAVGIVDNGKPALTVAVDVKGAVLDYPFKIGGQTLIRVLPSGNSRGSDNGIPIGDDNGNMNTFVFCKRFDIAPYINKKILRKSIPKIQKV